MCDFGGFVYPVYHLENATVILYLINRNSVLAQNIERCEPYICELMKGQHSDTGSRYCHFDAIDTEEISVAYHLFKQF